MDKTLGSNIRRQMKETLSEYTTLKDVLENGNYELAEGDKVIIYNLAKDLEELMGDIKNTAILN